MAYLFGPVRVDGEARRVSRGGSPVHLTRKALDVLLLLLEHRPNAVTKEEIHARIWPETFVSESSVQSLISEIRHALDDPAPAASWIGTVHGIGYRFDGEIVDDQPPGTTPPPRPLAWLIGPTIRLPLVAGANVVGRGLDAATEIDAPTMSRQHACITIGAEATIEDLDSKNGTWVDGARVDGRAALRDGAEVRLGTIALTFRRATPARPTEPAG